jgi:hypothetical protein
LTTCGTGLLSARQVTWSADSKSNEPDNLSDPASQFSVRTSAHGSRRLSCDWRTHRLSPPMFRTVGDGFGGVVPSVVTAAQLALLMRGWFGACPAFGAGVGVDFQFAHRLV